MFEGNPFPGLRPFQFDENYLFFGREEQVSQLLQRLGNTRFLAVVGASGSGKSSLVRAGLLPELHGGTMTSTSIAWELAIMRPGGDPLTNLAESLVESGLFGEENEENILQTRATLSRSGLGLIESYRQSSIDKGANLLLLSISLRKFFAFAKAAIKPVRKPRTSSSCCSRPPGSRRCRSTSSSPCAQTSSATVRSSRAWPKRSTRANTSSRDSTASSELGPSRVRSRSAGRTSPLG